MMPFRYVNLLPTGVTMSQPKPPYVAIGNDFVRASTGYRLSIINGSGTLTRARVIAWDYKLARHIVEAAWNMRMSVGLPTNYVGLCDVNGLILELYNGRWSSAALLAAE